MTPARLPESGLSQQQGVHICVTARAGSNAHLSGVPSDSRDQVFPFLCRYTLTNHGPAPFRLMTRHWKVCDAYHHLKELHGPCIPGQQPIIQPGASYTFQVTIGLPTEWGSLAGSFRFEDSAGDIVDVSFDQVLLAPGSTSRVEAVGLAPAGLS